MNSDSLEKQWSAYLTAYGPVAAEERERLLKLSVCDDVVFTNPGGEGRTRAGLIAHIEGFQTKMPRFYFTGDKLFLRHGEFLAIWSMYTGDGVKAATGYNYVRLDTEGRISYLAGFF